MVYGVKQPSPLSSLPLGGYSIGQISRALVSILVALAEWSTGRLQVFPTLFPLTQDIDDRLKELSHLLLMYKNSRPKAWFAFCLEVYRFAAESRGSSLLLRPETCLSSSLAEYCIEAE